MSKLGAHLSELTTRLQSAKPSVTINRNLDRAHARLTQAARSSRRQNRLRDVTESSLRNLATSLGLECWSDEPSNGLRILSITGQIIVVDVAFDVLTDEVKSCTLVLASEDGLQDEIVSDGRDTMFENLRTGRLDLFTRNLAKLALLDRQSNPAIGLSMFQVHDLIREALNKKLTGKLGYESPPIPVASHLSLPLVYWSRKTIFPQSIIKVEAPQNSCLQYIANIELEEQPVSARPELINIENFSMEEVLKKPVLRYPKAWIDSSNTWLPMKHLMTARYKEDVRYVLALDPPVTIALSALTKLARGSTSTVETDTTSKWSQRYRRIQTPFGPQDAFATFEMTEELVVLRRIAFTHPKEVEHILSVLGQFAWCEELLKSFGPIESIPDATQPDIHATRWKLKLSLLEDAETKIDNRQTISITISDVKISEPLASIEIRPDGSMHCTHQTNTSFFTKALNKIGDIPIGLIATASQSPIR